MARYYINDLPVEAKLQLLDFILDNSQEALDYAMLYHDQYMSNEYLRHDDHRGMDANRQQNTQTGDRATTSLIFSPANHNKCEGYWSKGKENSYLPVVSDKVWEGKEEWLRKAFVVSDNTPVVAYRGIAFSRLDGTAVGNEEYQDEANNMCWPSGYLEHYVRDNNVMPTEKFYNYVNSRYEDIIRSHRY